MKKKKPIIFSALLALLVCSCDKTPSQSIAESTPSTPSVIPSETITPSETIKPSESTKPTAPSVQPSTPDEFDRDLYVSATSTNYEAKGTLEDPMMLRFAIRESRPGRTIWLMDGTYSYGSTIMMDSTTEQFLAANAEEGKVLRPINPGKAVFDFSDMAWASANRGIQVNSSFWHIRDLEVFGSGDNGIYIGGSHNIVENCVTHDCGDTGIQLGRANSAQLTIDQWPSYNLIKNCTSYDNHDPLGEDSDGFACKLTTGVGNVFDGCIAYNNVDDGWDLYTKGDTGPIGSVTLINCIAFNNGVTSGKNTDGLPYGTPNSDGNGFKLGGEVIAVPHVVKNCIAFNNLACGFTDNSNPGPLNIQNCTSYNNGLRDSDANNIDMCRDENTSVNYLKNLLSYCDTNVKFTDDTTKNFNSKDQFKGTVVNTLFYYGRTLLRFKGINEADYTVATMMGELIKCENTPFVSTQIPDELSNFHEIWRDENGNIKLGDFLKVKDEFVQEAFGESFALGADLA